MSAVLAKFDQVIELREMPFDAISAKFLGAIKCPVGRTDYCLCG
jgi:hypothetical protein